MELLLLSLDLLAESVEQLGGEHAVAARLGEASGRGAFALVAELAREVEEALAKRS